MSMAVAKGDRLVVAEVVWEGKAQVIRTTDGSAFGIAGVMPVQPGDTVELGNVCGGWAFIFYGGEKYRGKVLVASA